MITNNKNSAIVPVSNELLALRLQAKNIAFFDGNRVNSNISGNKLSLARGRGMDFDEVRQYQAGDDIRMIHWSLTARLGKPYTKIYKEERQRMVYLVVDQSSTMHFGTKVCFKNVLAAKIAALLGWAAIGHQEQVGGIVFNDQYTEYVKPHSSRNGILRLFKFLTQEQQLRHHQGGMEFSLQLLANNIQSGSVVIIISDFFKTTPETYKYLQLINRKAEVINFMTYDPLEQALPEFGSYTFTDNGQHKLEISATKTNKLRYQDSFTLRQQQIERFSRSNNMQFVPIATNDNLMQIINRGISKYGY